MRWRKQAIAKTPLHGRSGHAIGAGQQAGEQIVGHRKRQPHGEVVDLLDAAVLSIALERDRLHRHQLIVRIDVLEPEHEILRGQRLPIAPAQAAPQIDGGNLAVVAQGPGFRDVRRDAVACPIPCKQGIRPGHRTPRVPGIAGAGKALAPGATVLADLVQRLDDQRVGANPVGQFWQRAGGDPRRHHRSLLELLGPLGGIKHHLWALELADQRAADCSVLREGLRRRAGQTRSCRERNQLPAMQFGPSNVGGHGVSPTPARLLISGRFRPLACIADRGPVIWKRDTVPSRSQSPQDAACQGNRVNDGIVGFCCHLPSKTVIATPCEAIQTRPKGLVVMLDCFARARNDGLRTGFSFTRLPCGGWSSILPPPNQRVSVYSETS